MTASFILAQLSDTHVMARDHRDKHGRSFRGGAHAAQLKRALEATREFKPNAILITGDLANDARADEYAVLAKALINPPAPLYLVPGNHDDVALMREMLPTHRYFPKSGPLSYAIEEYPVRLVCVDQVVAGETFGLFTEAHADWLDATLAAASTKPTLVALHHPPFPTHDRLFDEIGLREAERFAAVIAKHRQVQRIVCGHHHRGVIGQVAHVPAIIAPSTAWAYSDAMQPDQKLAQITGEQPGWVLHAWNAQSGFASHFMGLPR